MAPTLRASQKGLKKVDIARRKKGWRTDALAWYSAAQTTLATLKRFRRGEAIQRDAFIGICKAVGIDNWEDIVDESEVDCVDSDSGGDVDLATWQKEKRYGQFVGRTDELEEILKSLESEEKIKVLSIVGIGGLGKTALCHQLAYQAYQAKVFTKIAWVRAK
ncbi:MAG: ATP-binding protein, partial [Okeania sp. SIO2D1]|nr:ATP-binding protein [Okeania sp. SIO2D1]